jgi:hypothetical protein
LGAAADRRGDDDRIPLILNIDRDELRGYGIRKIYFPCDEGWQGATMSGIKNQLRLKTILLKVSPLHR